MSARRARLVLVAALAAAAGPVLGIAAHAAPSGPTPPSPYNATINQGNVPTTAAAYTQDCNSGEFGNKPAADDGWLFVASPSNFSALKAIFHEGDFVLGASNNPAGTSAYFTKANDHLAVITPAGWTLTQAYATLDGDKSFFTLSHTCAATPQQQPTTAPSASRTGSSCDHVTFSLSAGSSDTTFTVQRTGESTTTSVPVPANQTVSHDVALDSAHPGATVSVGSNQVASFTRPDSCNESSSTGGDNGNGGDSNGSGSTPGDTGGTGSAGGTGGTGGSGGTGGGTVAGETGSQGNGPTTAVLGEKLTKVPGTTTGSTPTSVEATGVSTLPLTGFATVHAIEIALALFGLGAGATVLGRRRRVTR